MSTGKMGYRNFNAAQENVVTRGKLLRPYHGVLSADMSAYGVLTTMCMHTYDWPLTAKQRSKHSTSRLYIYGLKQIALDMGLIDIPHDDPDFVFGEEGAKAKERREKAAIQRVSNAMSFLKKQGVVKTLVPGYLGHNAYYLLLIGTPEENAEVEEYDRRVLGLEP